MIAAKILGYYWVDGKANPADVVSQHWGFQQIWHLHQPVLDFSIETNDLLEREQKEKSKIILNTITTFCNLT
jgi:hypothetical protein